MRDERLAVVSRAGAGVQEQCDELGRPVGRGVVERQVGVVDLDLARCASCRQSPAGNCRPPGVRSIVVSARLSASSSTHSPITVVEPRNRSRSADGDAVDSVGDVAVAGLVGGVHRDRAPLVHPLERAGQPLGVQRQVRDDVGAGPAGQQARLRATGRRSSRRRSGPAAGYRSRAAPGAGGRTWVHPAQPGRRTERGDCRRPVRGCRMSKIGGAAACSRPVVLRTFVRTDTTRDRGLAGAGEAHHPGRPGAQPQGHLARPAARLPDRLHRAVRLRQVQPGVRHDLRRGPAALRRVAVGVRPPVPRPDGQARRRLHRGAEPRGLDRPEVHVARTPARPSAPSPRSTTTSGCSTRGPAGRTARSAAARSSGRRRSRSSTG